MKLPGITVDCAEGRDTTGAVVRKFSNSESIDDALLRREPVFIRVVAEVGKTEDRTGEAVATEAVSVVIRSCARAGPTDCEIIATIEIAMIPIRPIRGMVDGLVRRIPAPP